MNLNWLKEVRKSTTSVSSRSKKFSIFFSVAIYYVTERCQDGWFKGMDRSHKSGVFPGNFVVPLRNHRPIETSQATNCSAALPSTSAHEKRPKNKDNSKREHSIEPPQLPPRLDGSSSSSTTSSTSVWSKPLGQHVEAFFGRKSKNDSTNDSSTSTTNKDTKSSSTSSSSTVDLIKRFANMKLSKSLVSAPSAGYSMDNPVFEDVIGATASTQPSNSPNRRNVNSAMQPAHVRSGSCPSQLLQSLPVDINQTISEATIKKLDPTGTNGAYMFGSQRIKSHKERTPLSG